MNNFFVMNTFHPETDLCEQHQHLIFAEVVLILGFTLYYVSQVSTVAELSHRANLISLSLECFTDSHDIRMYHFR